MKNEKEWFCEGTVPGKRYGKIEHCFLIDKLIYKGKTPYQSILIFDHSVYGRVLVIDDIVQLSISDEFIYHEMITHPIMLTHPKPDKILIIGGGDGGTLRECLKYNSESIFIVEIDKEVIEVSKSYLPTISQDSFAHNKVKLFYDNGKDFIKKYENFFDVIIVDCSDPVGPSLPLFNVKFYKDIFKALKTNGMASFQVGSFLDSILIKETFSKLEAVFPSIIKMRLTMPSYHCGEYCFMGASKQVILKDVKIQSIAKKFNELNFEESLKYYTPEMHQASQILPKVPII